LRKLAPLLTAVLLLLAALFVSPVGALAASSPGPVIPGPDSGARPSIERVPSGRLQAAPSLTLGAPVACNGGFNAVTSANGAGYNFLNAASALNANDVWSVGSWSNASGYDQTLVEHWDGTSWTLVPSLNIGSLHNDLNGVVAISTNDVWAVGTYTTTVPPMGYAPNTNAVAMHWNGTSWGWFLLKPYPSNLFAEINAVTAISSTDVWAVGRYWSAGYLPFVEHWDGTSWTPTLIANPGPSDNNLFAVSAWSSTDVWAVGLTTPSGFTVRQGFAEHWNGIGWSWITTPNTATGDNAMFGVNALEAGHAVGVGFGNFVSGTTPRQSAAWDIITPGTSTVTVLGSGLGTGTNLLQGVSRFGSGLQAVGYSRSTPTAPYQTLAFPANWDSAGHALTWGAVGATANPGALDSVFFATAALSPQAFWATGFTDASTTTATQTLTELYCAHVSITGPAPTYVGAPFSLTVTAQNPNTTTATGYRGTVHFTSSDPAAVMPPDYTFTAGDAGMHVFTGVVLNTTGVITITASDPVTSFVLGTGTFTVTCRGVCPGPGGVAGARDATQGPAGTAGSRVANQSAASTAGPRRPMLALGGALSGAASAPAIGLAPAGAGTAAASTAQPAASAIAAAPSDAQAAIAVSHPEPPVTVRDGDMMAASRSEAIQHENSPGYLPLVLIPLAIISMTLVVFRRRMNRRLIGHTRP